MSVPRRRSLFVDTGAFYARFSPRDENHESAVEVFDAIRERELIFGPMFTSQSVLGELATLLDRHTAHNRAVEAMDSIVDSTSSFEVLPIDVETFHSAYSQFRRFDDQEISFVDHTGGVLAKGRGVEHVFT